MPTITGRSKTGLFGAILTVAFTGVPDIGFLGLDVVPGGRAEMLRPAPEIKFSPRGGPLQTGKVRKRGLARHASRSLARVQNMLTNSTNRLADSVMAHGRVRTQAISRLRTVSHCRPDPLAAMVPATPDDRTWVVETGSPNTSAAPIVPMATRSAEAPCA